MREKKTQRVLYESFVSKSFPGVSYEEMRVNRTTNLTGVLFSSLHQG